MIYDVFVEFWSVWMPESVVLSHWFEILAVLSSILFIFGIIVMFLSSLRVKSKFIGYIMVLLVIIVSVFYFYEFIWLVR